MDDNTTAPVATPFQWRVPDADIADLKARLALTRWPDEAPGAPWAFGTSVAWLRSLVEYWRCDFDWRQQEAALNAWPQFKVPLDGIDLHFLHVRGKGPAPMPLLLSHGWPGSVLEFMKLIPLLTDPAAHGGDAADAFTVVAPSLPGFGLSFAPGQPRLGCEQMADTFARLMTQVLGYRRFAAQGGDWGAFVTSRLACCHPDSLFGIHLNLLALQRDPAPLPDASAAEQQYLQELAFFLADETGYQAIQGTRPQTLAFGLTDSPAGLAAWIAEKFRAWSDCDGDPLRVFSCDELLATSACTGSPARSVPRSGRITRGRTTRGRFRPAIASPCRPPMRPFRAKFCDRRARWPNGPTTSVAGPRCRGADILPRWSSPRPWRTTSGNSSGRCALAADRVGTKIAASRDTTRPLRPA